MYVNAIEMKLFNTVKTMFDLTTSVTLVTFCIWSICLPVWSTLFKQKSRLTFSEKKDRLRSERSNIMVDSSGVILVKIGDSASQRQGPTLNSLVFRRAGS